MRRLRRFFTHWQNVIGLLMVLAFVAIAVAAPLISPDDPEQPGVFRQVGEKQRAIERQPQPPSDIAPLGTLPGRFDIFHALVWGTRDALKFGLLVALTTGAFGVIFGAVAGYAGGFVNRLMMRVADSFLAFPVVAGVALLTSLLLAVLPPLAFYFPDDPLTPARTLTPLEIILRGVDPLTFTLILFSWMPYARLVNTLVLQLKNTDFIQAARALGGSPFRIIFRHLIPNAVSPALVLAARDVGGMVIMQATFTFIGLGGGSAWGQILAVGRSWLIGPGGNIFKTWWVVIPATVTVVLFGVAWNILGDGLTDLLDPHST